MKCTQKCYVWKKGKKKVFIGSQFSHSAGRSYFDLVYDILKAKVGLLWFSVFFFFFRFLVLPVSSCLVVQCVFTCTLFLSAQSLLQTSIRERIFQLLHILTVINLTSIWQISFLHSTVWRHSGCLQSRLCLTMILVIMSKQKRKTTTNCKLFYFCSFKMGMHQRIETTKTKNDPKSESRSANINTNKLLNCCILYDFFLLY